MTLGYRATGAAHEAPATRSGAAHGSQVEPPARRSRSGVAVGVAAVVAGSAIGSGLALQAAPASSSRAHGAAETAAGAARPPANASGEPPAGSLPQSSGAAPSGPAPATPRPSVPGAPADPRAALVTQIRDTLIRFVAWSHEHPGAPCPDAAALGAPAPDPWGQPLRIVCADQPEDQIAGVLSYGPDGAPGTRDDVASWTLGAEVTDPVRGSRWGARRSAAAGAHGSDHAPPGTVRMSRATAPSTSSTAAVARPAAIKPPASAGAGSNSSDGDGIPDRR